MTDSFRSAPPAPDEQRTTRSVGVASVALVAAVWASLTLAPEPRSEAENPSIPELDAAHTELVGFRADLFQLPDDPLAGFVQIAAGPFTMGSDPGADPLAFDVEWWGDGRVQGTVELPSFYLARLEVSVAQYAVFVSATGYPVPDPATLNAPPTHPVAHVAWTDAVAYASWLDSALRSSPETPDAISALLRDGWRVSIPTEAQWEKAARGTDGRVYPWGNDVRPDRANYRASGVAPVGTFPCPDCAHGLSDMAGNVWEWTLSPYQPYPYTETDDREGLDNPALWVMRGGSFGDTEQFIRTANRGGADPGARRPFIGVRVALTRD